MRSQREQGPSIISYETHSQTVDLPGRSRLERTASKDLSANRQCRRPECPSICEGVDRNVPYFCQIVKHIYLHIAHFPSILYNYFIFTLSTPFHASTAESTYSLV